MLAPALGPLLTGCCGGRGSNSPGPVDDQGGIVMQLDIEYAVTAGDSVIPEGEDTCLAVRHVFEGDRKYVTLLAGSATLLPGEGSELIR